MVFKAVITISPVLHYQTKPCVEHDSIKGLKRLTSTVAVCVCVCVRYTLCSSMKKCVHESMW